MDRLILAKRFRQKKSETKLNKQSVLVVARKKRSKTKLTTRKDAVKKESNKTRMW